MEQVDWRTEYMEQRRLEPRDWYAEIDGNVPALGRALHVFFEALKDDREASPQDLQGRLAEDHNLTEGQKTFLDHATVRAIRAQEIIRYLEHRFGTDNLGKFADPQGVYSILYSGQSPKNIEAYSQNITIKFVKLRGRILASTDDCFGIDQLKEPLERTIERLSKNKKTWCRALSYTLAGPKYFQKVAKEHVKEQESRLSAEEKLMRALFGGSNIEAHLEEETERHCLRNVFDNIMGVLPAFSGDGLALYARRPSPEGIHVRMLSELERYKRSVEYRKERLEELRVHPALKNILESEERMLCEAQARYEQAERVLSILTATVKSLPVEEWPVLSYMISIATNQTNADDLANGTIAERLNSLATSLRIKHISGSGLSQLKWEILYSAFV